MRQLVRKWRQRTKTQFYNLRSIRTKSAQLVFFQ